METPKSDITKQVIADLTARDLMGWSKYGRAVEDAEIDALQEAYEEGLDWCIYLKLYINRQKERQKHETF